MSDRQGDATMGGDVSNGLVPVTMLSGFLGAGKTTLLKHILENSKIKIACVVNDVSGVNIDAKLVRNAQTRGGGRQDENGGAPSAVADMVELQNGCACCSAADELFPAFAQILEMGEKRGEPFDRIVLENSGVAEPQNIRDSFVEASAMGHPVLDKMHLSNLITVVDSATFIQDFSSRAPLMMRPDLGEGGTMRPVVDLLVEQIECADVVLLNKTDMVDPRRVASLPPIVASMNPLARVLTCSHGKIPLEVMAQPGIISKLNVEAQHRSAVVAVKEQEGREKAAKEAASKKDDHAHHDHSHSHEHHGHSHDHHHHDDHKHGEKDHTHDHHHHGDHHHGGKGHGHDHHHHGHDHHHGEKGHAHDHHHHDHDHDHGHNHGEKGHSHDHHHHDHDHGESRQTTAEKRFGIRSFVYRNRTPFHPLRLRELVLKWLPAAHNSALGGQAPAEGDRPIKKVLRSKGFVWLSNNHTTAFYWSHAGQHFELREEGDWWAAVGDADWPEEKGLSDVVLSDFEGEFGDRRQEIVFIGANMEEDKIKAQLDEALLTPAEMKQYVDNWAPYPDPINPGKMMTKCQPQPPC
ncbi:hypothetical protein BSKO_03331 [Bryopsis sp. KO-2023]|nr:hypothetical protein BSKO_03331 [Bryopsis sp. KO-2023]